MSARRGAGSATALKVLVEILLRAGFLPVAKLTTVEGPPSFPFVRRARATEALPLRAALSDGEGFPAAGKPFPRERVCLLNSARLWPGLECFELTLRAIKPEDLKKTPPVFTLIYPIFRGYARSMYTKL